MILGKLQEDRNSQIKRILSQRAQLRGLLRPEWDYFKFKIKFKTLPKTEGRNLARNTPQILWVTLKMCHYYSKGTFRDFDLIPSISLFSIFQRNNVHTAIFG